MSAKLNTIRSHILKYSAVFLGMFAVGYASANYLIESAKSNQSTALNSVLFNAKLGKSLAFVNVQLEAHDIPENPNDTAEITGYITLLKSSNQVMHYQWVLPNGVSIVEGNSEGQFESVTVEQPIPITVTVKGYSKYEKKLLTLTASTVIGETSFSNVAILSSRPEDSLEFIAKQKFDAEKMQRLDLSSESPDSPEDLNTSPRSQDANQH